MRPRFALLLALLLGVVSQAAWPQDGGPGGEAIALLREYLRIDTVNPPGNEQRAALFLARVLEREGIPYTIAESAPGRGNLWARLPGGAEPALILLHHMDVVPAEASYWDVPPFGGEMREDMIYGRGALDMKSAGIMHLMTFLALHRAGRPLRRDVLFVASADEEAGGDYGAGWLVRTHPEIFGHSGLLLNEGGGGRLVDDDLSFSIEVAQKIPLWLRFTAMGEPGHGSSPRPNSAVSRLIQALVKLQAYQFPPRILPSVDAYFKGLAEQQRDPEKSAYADIGRAVREPGFLTRLQAENPGLHALTRDTCSITRLAGSGKINVVPPAASAEIDCRLLPDQDPERFLQLLGTVIDDPSIAIEVILSFQAAASRTDSELYQAITRVIGRRYPQAPVLPGIIGGFTDSHYFRDLGIDSYGFTPFIVPETDRGGVHGHNERISGENIRNGLRLLQEIVGEIVY